MGVSFRFNIGGKIILDIHIVVGTERDHEIKPKATHCLVTGLLDFLRAGKGAFGELLARRSEKQGAFLDEFLNGELGKLGFGLRVGDLRPVWVILVTVCTGMPERNEREDVLESDCSSGASLV